MASWIIAHGGRDRILDFWFVLGNLFLEHPHSRVGRTSPFPSDKITACLFLPAIPTQHFHECFRTLLKYSLTFSLKPLVFFHLINTVHNRQGKLNFWDFFFFYCKYTNSNCAMLLKILSTSCQTGKWVRLHIDFQENHFTVLRITDTTMQLIKKKLLHFCDYLTVSSYYVMPGVSIWTAKELPRRVILWNKILLHTCYKMLHGHHNICFTNLNRTTLPVTIVFRVVLTILNSSVLNRSHFALYLGHVFVRLFTPKLLLLKVVCAYVGTSPNSHKLNIPLAYFPARVYSPFCKSWSVRELLANLPMLH